MRHDGEVLPRPLHPDCQVCEVVFLLTRLPVLGEGLQMHVVWSK
jgi:hypothetical protein